MLVGQKARPTEKPTARDRYASVRWGQEQERENRETAAILGRKLEQMALEERVPGDAETWRSTPLGRELHSHLLMVFLGLWDEWEVPMILQDYGVIDDLECEAIWDLLGAGRDAEMENLLFGLTGDVRPPERSMGRPALKAI
jgi:hypothetical protein